MAVRLLALRAGRPLLPRKIPGEPKIIWSILAPERVQTDIATLKPRQHKHPYRVGRTQDASFSTDLNMGHGGEANHLHARMAAASV
jgi:hypothetical protein